jgi:predicted neuraminidase
MLLRSACGRIYCSGSENGGRTWCEIYRTSLPNNNSRIDAAKLDDGTIALVLKDKLILGSIIYSII